MQNIFDTVNVCNFTGSFLFTYRQQKRMGKQTEHGLTNSSSYRLYVLLHKINIYYFTPMFGIVNNWMYGHIIRIYHYMVYTI